MEQDWMKGLMKGALSGLWLGALLLALAEAYRPGFLDLGRAEGWLTVVVVLLPFPLLGLAGAALRRTRRAIQRPRWWRVAAWAFLLLIPAAAHLLTPSMPEPRLGGGRRVVLLGVDGATWEVIEPLAKAGELPNFSRLLREGTTGVLTSEEPTLSPRVWTTIATGVGPERHGAVDFYSTQASIEVARIWEVVEAQGGRIGVLNWLLTWPPGTPDGFLVPGWMARDTHAWPPELSFLQTLREDDASAMSVGRMLSAGLHSVRNGVRLPTLVEAVRIAFWLKLEGPTDRESTPRTSILQANLSSEVFLHWLRRTGPDFAALVLYATDNMAHRHWRDYEPAKFGLDATPEEGRYRDALPDAYRQADLTLGRLMSTVDRHTVLIVISDHGTEAREGSGEITSIDAAALLRAIGMEGRLIAFSVGDTLYLRERDEDADPTGAAPSFVTLLRDARVDGSPLFEVDLSAPPYFSAALAGTPDLDAEASIGGRTLPVSSLLVRSRFSGEHTLDGIVGLWGPPIVSGGSLSGATIRDVAPTALAFLACPLSREMTGSVLADALRPEWRTSFAPAFVDSYGPPPHRLGDQSSEPELDEALREKLKALGYLE